MVRASELLTLIHAIKPTLSKEDIRIYIKSLKAKERTALLLRLRQSFKRIV